MKCVIILVVITMYEKAIFILKKINELGFEAYIIGGYPRDKYLNINSSDIDICSNIPSDILNKNFNITKYNNYASYIIDNEFELTLFRKDDYQNPRYPTIELVKTLKDDLIRRDFTINTLCLNQDGEYIDLMNAIDDINKKIIKTIKQADISFKEDPIRMIRALRFKIDLNFNLSEEIKKAMIDNKKLLKKINKKLLEKEIDKVKGNRKEIDDYIGDLYEGKNN